RHAAIVCVPDTCILARHGARVRDDDGKRQKRGGCLAASRAVLSMIFSLAVLVVTSSFHAFQPRLPMNLCQPGDSLLLARATEIPSAIGTLLQCSPGRRLAGRTDKPAVESDGANTDSIFLCANDLPRACSSPSS